MTVVEENSQVSQGASYRNGAILCQSMAASWACAHLLSENPGEMKSLRLGWRALTDPKFLLWCGWFWYNSLLTSRAQHAHILIQDEVAGPEVPGSHQVVTKERRVAGLDCSTLGPVLRPVLFLMLHTTV